MLAPVLAITAMDRLGGGLLALLLCLVAFIVWLFILIALGFVWRRLTRRNRERGMRVMIGGMFVLTAIVLVGIPRTTYDIGGTPTDPDFTENHSIGLTSWFVRRLEDRTNLPEMYQGPPIPPVIVKTTEISLVGMVVLLPALAVLFLLARWQWRNLPGFYRRPNGRCDWCDYDLRGHHSVNCPECGEEVA